MAETAASTATGSNRRKAAQRSNALSEQDAAKLERAAERLGLTGNGGAKMQITVGGSPENGLAAPQHPEGYAMKINEDGLTIAANSARGAFYALQTVAALADSCSDGGSLPFCEVRDWPDMDIRGIHAAHMDADALEHYSFMIENVLAPMKMNHILLECEYVAWDTTKGLHIPNAMSKEQLKQLLQTADENFIEVTPLFQTLSHVPWLFEGGKNLDMAEDPNYPLYFNKPNWIKSVHQVFILKHMSHLITGNSLLFKYLMFSWNSRCRSLMYCIFILLFVLLSLNAQSVSL